MVGHRAAQVVAAAIGQEGPFQPFAPTGERARELRRRVLGLSKANRETTVRNFDLVERIADDNATVVHHGHVIGHALHFFEQVR